MIINERREQPNQAAIFLIFCISLAISLGSSITFGVDTTDGDTHIAVVRGLVALILVGLYITFLSSEKITYYLPLPQSLTTHRIAIFCCIISFALSSFLLLFRLSQYEDYQVNLNNVTFWLAVIFFILLFLVQLLIQRPGYPSTILLISLASYLVLTFLQFTSVSFEVDPRQPFTLYHEAIDRFFIGLDPYQVYDSASSRPFTVLPGHWLSFIIFRFLKIDPRWMGGISQFLAVILIYLTVPKHRKHLAAYLLSLYILSPYQYSVEANYTGLLPLVFSLIFFLFAKKYYLMGAAALGWSLSLTLFSWLLIPFVFGHLFKNQPWRYWGNYILVAGIFASMQLLTFGMRFQDTFLYCTVKYWFDTFSLNGFNISYWLVPLVGEYGLYFLQASFFVVLFTQYIKSDRALGTSFTYSSICALIFLITNRVVEDYLFLLILLQAIMGFILTEKKRTDDAPIRIHRSPAESNPERNKP